MDVKKKSATRKRAKEALRKYYLLKQKRAAADKGSLTPIKVIKWLPPEKLSLSQIYSKGMQYAFVSAKGEICHSYILCKDYLQDAVHATIHGTTNKIHGFEFDGKKNPPVDLNCLRMIVRFKNNPDFGKQLEGSLKVLNYMEKKFGFRKTVLTYAGKDEDNQKAYMLTGDPMWMHAPPLISMYTMLIRGGLNYKSGCVKKHLLEKTDSKLAPNDGGYYKSGEPGIDLLVNSSPKKVFGSSRDKNYPKEIQTSTLHHSTGIVSFGQMVSGQQVYKTIKEKNFKHWNLQD